MPFQLLEQEWGGRREGMNQALQYFERRVTAIRVCVMIGRLCPREWIANTAERAGIFVPLKTRGPLLYRLTTCRFLFQEERAALTKELRILMRTAPAAGSGVSLLMEPATAGYTHTPVHTEGSSGTTGDASLYAPSPPESSTSADGSRGISGQFHAGGGQTDGCYALYGGADGAEWTVDQLLELMKVRRCLSAWGKRKLNSASDAHCWGFVSVGFGIKDKHFRAERGPGGEASVGRRIIQGWEEQGPRGMGIRRMNRG